MRLSYTLTIHFILEKGKQMSCEIAIVETRYIKISNNTSLSRENKAILLNMSKI